MRRYALLLALVAVLLVSSGAFAPSAAAPTAALFQGGWGDYDHYSFRAGPVAQQSDTQYPALPRFDPAWVRYVIDPFGRDCPWDVDVSWDVSRTGDVLGGTTASATFCEIADSRSVYRTINGSSGWWSVEPGAFGAFVRSKSASLVVTIGWPAQRRSFTLSPTYSPIERLYVYGPWCGTASYDSPDPTLLNITGSNGSTHPDSVEGRGVVSDIVLSIANPTNRTVRDVWAYAERIAVWESDTWTCNRDRFWFDLRENDYPFWWIDGAY